MQIKKATLFHLRIPMKFSFSSAKTLLSERDTVVIKLEDNNGVVGYGEAPAFVDPFYTPETLADVCKILSEVHLPKLLSGMYTIEHPFDVHKYCSKTFPMAIAGLENALVDIYYKARHENAIQTIFSEQLMPEIPMGLVLGDNLDAQSLQKKLSEYSEIGCKRVKLKISPETDFKYLKKVIESNNHLLFAVDANKSFTLDQLGLIQKLDSLGLLCIEEAFAFEAFEACKNVQKYIKTPLCLDESVQDLESLRLAHELKVFQVLNVKIGKFGGLYYTKQIIEFCRKNKISFWIGSMIETAISKSLHVQLASLPDVFMAGDLSASARYFEAFFTEPEICFENGYAQRPCGYGIGVKVLEENLEKYCIQKWENKHESY